MYLLTTFFKVHNKDNDIVILTKPVPESFNNIYEAILGELKSIVWVPFF